jgi:peroxiredoxin
MRPIVAALFFSSILVAAGTAQVALGPADRVDGPPTDIDRVQVGMKAPDFTLASYGGDPVMLSEFRGAKNVVLVFYRGYWCQYCIAQLKDLRSLLDAELQKDTELLVLSVDGANETKQTISRIGSDGGKSEFIFLSDPEHAVIDRYGLLNPSGTRRGIPHPATFVIDKTGVVRWRNVETNYRIRPDNATILEALRALPRS